MKISKGDLVRIDWYDHYSSNMGWRKLSDWSGKIGQEVCSSVGLVVGLDAKQVCLAQNWHPIEGDTNIADFMVIIRGCIKKITVIKKKEIK